MFAEIPLSVKNLKFSYRRGRKEIPVFHDLNLEIEEGEALGICGPSGAGKSTLMECLLRLKDFEGEVLYWGRASRLWKRQEFCRQVQGVIQDCQGALDPRWTARDTVAESIRVVLGLAREQALRKASMELSAVGVPPEAHFRLNSELSGGQRQRVLIARAFALNPRLLVLDEITSSLDLGTQKDLLEKLKEKKEKEGVSLLFVSHDRRAVHFLCDRVLSWESISQSYRKSDIEI